MTFLESTRGASTTYAMDNYAVGTVLSPEHRRRDLVIEKRVASVFEELFGTQAKTQSSQALELLENLTPQEKAQIEEMGLNIQEQFMDYLEAQLGRKISFMDLSSPELAPYVESFIQNELAGFTQDLESVTKEGRSTAVAPALIAVTPYLTKLIAATMITLSIQQSIELTDKLKKHMDNGGSYEDFLQDNYVDIGLIAADLTPVGKIVGFLSKSFKFSTAVKIAASARKLGFETKEGLAKLTKEFRELVGSQAGSSRLHEPLVDMLENLAKKGYRKADPSKLVNTLNDFRVKNFQLGSTQLGLNKTNMKHILERHHPDFWNGTIKNGQSFFSKNTSLDNVADLVGDVVKQNRDLIQQSASKKMFQVSGKVNGKEYILGVRSGQIRQFYPVNK